MENLLIMIYSQAPGESDSEPIVSVTVMNLMINWLKCKAVF